MAKKKKAATKSNKSTATKSGDKKPAATKTKRGPNQVGNMVASHHKILTALKGTKPTTAKSRKELSKATGIKKGFSKILGAYTKDELDADSLLGKKYVECVKFEEGRELCYHITAAGTKALAAADKAATKE